jgi:DNA-binding NarL/FixJ family response regulator
MQHKPQVSILIIEDNPLTAAQLATIVNNISHDITVSTTAERGLLIWGNAFHSDKPYQVLITDINLPGMNGKELCQEIRDVEVMAQVKNRTQMIAISADPPAKHLLEACRLGAGCYLQKPVSKEKLLEALRNTGLFGDH